MGLGPTFDGPRERSQQGDRSWTAIGLHQTGAGAKRRHGKRMALIGVLSPQQLSQRREIEMPMLLRPLSSSDKAIVRNHTNQQAQQREVPSGFFPYVNSS